MKLFKHAAALAIMLLSFSAVNAVTCDCDPFEEPTLCVDLGGIVVPMTQCDYDCFISLGDDEISIVECGETTGNPGGDIIDCDCDFEDDLIICVEDENGFVMPIPECLYNCKVENGFPEMTIVDCDGVIIGGGEVDDCDCEGQEDVIICVEDEFGMVTPFPECLYNCISGEEGFPEMTIVDCDGIIIGGGDGNDCDCDLEDDVIICVEDEYGYVMPIPECIYNCKVENGFPEMTIVDCDGVIIGSGEVDDCDCEGQEDVIICVEDEFGMVSPIPECLYNCISGEEGFPEMTIVDCDGIIIGGGDGNDCDCDLEDDVIICVEDEYGYVMPIPECIYNCKVENGFPEMTIVDCDGIIIGGGDGNDCDCDLEDDVIICVQDEEGFEMEIPECLYNCLVADGMPEMTIVDCGADGPGILEQFDGYSNFVEEVTVFPNPTGGKEEVNFNILSSDEGIVILNILDLTGKSVHTENIKLINGEATYSVNIQDLDKGIYLTTLNNESGVLMTKKLIKQ